MAHGELSMENFSLNSAKSFVGKNVNLHLKDGAVIVNVHLTKIRRASVGKNVFIDYITSGKRSITSIPLRNVAYAEMLNHHMLMAIQN